jgi:hypothetical protein
MTSEKRVVAVESYDYMEVSNFEIKHLYIDSWVNFNGAVLTSIKIKIDEEFESEHNSKHESSLYSNNSFDEDSSCHSHRHQTHKIYSSMILSPTNITACETIQKPDQ